MISTLPAISTAAQADSTTPSQASQERTTLRSRALTEPPAIDGVLDDAAWTAPPLDTGEWLSYNPLYGNTIPQKTQVWIGHDGNYLYFAFQCDDPDPSGIKTSITRRDNIWADDWVGLSLDALNTGQFSYHLMVNPNGVQLDMLNSVAGGEDQSPDYVWDSAGRRNAKGYAVEMRVPLQTIRFRGGGDVAMGILFWRRVSRLGVSVAWPPLEPGKWVFEKHAALRFGALQPRLAREVIPSTTYVRTQTRQTPSAWAPADDEGDFGASAKYGITSTITLDATVNPDFSQVESDAFQVEVNQRFPNFFSEKRPFFMEGAGIFTLAGQGNDNSLQTAVHTRRIVDPVFGAKLTASTGRLAFGTLTALDQAPGRNLPEDDPNIGKDRLFNIARAQYSLGPSNYVGGLAIDTEFGAGYNRVIGSDLSWRVNSTQRLSAFVLASAAKDAVTLTSKSGMGAQAGYEYDTRRLTMAVYGEHYDNDFQMDTAFINRVGITSGWGYAQYSFYPAKTKQWLLRISPFSFTQGGKDVNAGGHDLLQVTGIRLNFSRQGNLRIDRFDGFEAWAGQRFDRGNWRFQGNVQLYRWLSVDGQYLFGNAVFYDPVDPYQGVSADGRVGITLQPGGRLSQAFNYRRLSFDRKATGEHVYDLDLIYSRTTYQFSREFFVRGIVQFDSSRHRGLTDFLASYELRPGTVVFAGYGSLIERREYVEGEWVPGPGDYATTQRGLFFKASYLHRF
ncbi:MAG TPA: DUF5916 domain-containing protein [Vicinamibacterales bacterium]|nr:DUF5916 domain-containing protein [Vicinamibacterales bacterium]